MSIAAQFLQRLRQFGLAFAIILGLVLLYFLPVLQGKELPQSDVQSFEAAQQELFEYRDTHDGEEPLWSTNLFSGMPAYLIHYKTEGSVSALLAKLFFKPSTLPILVMLVGMLCFYGLLRMFNVEPLLSVAGAIAFGFFSYHIEIWEAGHSNKLIVLMMNAPVLFGTALAYRRNALTGFVIFTLGLGLNFHANHVQMSYFLAMVLVGYAAYELSNHILTKHLKRYLLVSALLLLGGGLAFGLNAPRLLTLQEYAAFSIRGKSDLAPETMAKINPQENGQAPPEEGLDRDYAFGWSNSRAELLTLLIPNAMGGGSQWEIDKESQLYRQTRAERLPTYWGPKPFTSAPVYVGATISFLFILGLLIVPGGLKYALLYVTVLIAAMSMGKFSLTLPEALVVFALPAIYIATRRFITKIPQPVYGFAMGVVAFILLVVVQGDGDAYLLTDFFFDYLPLYNKFRAPSSLIAILGVTMPWMAFLGVHALFRKDIPTKKKEIGLYLAAGGTGLVCLVLALVPDLYGGDFTGPQDARMFQNNAGLLNAMRELRAEMLAQDAWRSFFFIALTAGVLWAFVKGYLKQVTLATGLVAALVAMDLLVVDTRILSYDDYVEPRKMALRSTPMEADRYLDNYQKDGGYFRVLPLSRDVFNDGNTIRLLHSVGGYHPAKLKRYQQLISAHLGKVEPNVVNMLNTEYYIVQAQRRAQLERLPFLEHVHTTQQGESIFRNLQNYGPAWIVQEARVMPRPDEVLLSLDTVNSRQTAMIEASQQELLAAYSKDSVDRAKESIALISHDNREVRYSYTSPKARFVTFSEVYYPHGWHAKIDGEEAPILQTNFVLRGMVVPAGKHEIVFRFDPEIVEETTLIAYASSTLLLLMLGGALLLEVRRRGQKDPDAPEPDS